MKSVFIQNTFLGYFHVHYKDICNSLKWSLGQMYSVTLDVCSSIFPHPLSSATLMKLCAAPAGWITECFQVSKRLVGPSKTSLAHCWFICTLICGGNTLVCGGKKKLCFSQLKKIILDGIFQNKFLSAGILNWMEIGFEVFKCIILEYLRWVILQNMLKENEENAYFNIP